MTQKQVPSADTSAAQTDLQVSGAPITDAVDRILVQEATAYLRGAASAVVVIDDLSGGVLSGLPSTVRSVRLHCDSSEAEERAVRAGQACGYSLTVSQALEAELVRDASLVVMRLPKSLAALAEIAELIAVVAGQGVTVVAGGRDKHMSRGMNAVLARYFDTVWASRGQQKSRVLFASGPRPGTGLSKPRREFHPDLGITVCAYGDVFAGTSIDLGTRFLVSFLPQMLPGAQSAIDLGCGTGVLATLLARRSPTMTVLAVDDSAAACQSAAATANANGIEPQIEIRRTHKLPGAGDRTVDLILCNPPFHRGTTRDSSTAFELFAEARRRLRPGGELWTVFNSHLPYLPALRRLVGATDIVGRNTSYLVARSVSAAE